MKKKQRISDLFYDNRFLLVFSLIVAVGFWLVVAVELGVEVENKIKNVPVQIDYEKVEENLGLKPFGETQFTVDVTVSGKKYIVESDDIVDNIVVEANTSFVNSAGTYTLKLDVGSQDARPAYKIEEVSAEEITVYFDYPDNEEFVVVPEIECEGELVAEGYYIADYIFPEANTVKVSGPETEVNKISKVAAKAKVDGGLRQSETVDAALVALTQDGETVRNVSFSRQTDVIRITLPVYKITTLPVECGFTNKPSDYVENLPFTVSVSPSSARFGVPEKKLEGMTAFEITTIDFSKLNAGVNTFVIKASDITNAVVLDGTEEFTVTVTVHGMQAKAVTAPSAVSFVNAPVNAKAELVKLDFSEITVIGPADILGAIAAEDITLTADLGGVEDGFTGNVTVPVTITDNDCWSCGEYTATISIS